ncbi:serum response factor homolog B-like [Thrips palmi]|uniref:Serum response factor homolog B-like n=1 Tax=Thrips palmi TaxID=161013 RepID=A0A6P8Z007_THRPL|nr:serum response factor homolog B-like [Thrips palmi]
MGNIHCSYDNAFVTANNLKMPKLTVFTLEGNIYQLSNFARRLNATQRGRPYHRRRLYRNNDNNGGSSSFRNENNLIDISSSTTHSNGDNENNYNDQYSQETQDEPQYSDYNNNRNVVSVQNHETPIQRDRNTQSDDRNQNIIHNIPEQIMENIIQEQSNNRSFNTRVFMNRQVLLHHTTPDCNEEVTNELQSQMNQLKIQQPKPLRMSNQQLSIKVSTNCNFQNLYLER